MTGFDTQEAANSYYAGKIRPAVMSPEYGPMVRASDILDAFAAGAAWQKERTLQMQLDAKPAALGGYDAECEFYSEIRDALGTLGEGMAATLQGIKSLQEAGLRGADRGVAILKHLQEIGDNVRGVSGAIGDKFGVVLDAVKDVGEKVEACMTIASNTEEGLAVSIEKLDKLGVEKWREAIKHVEAEGTTEPMHAEVKAQPVENLFAKDMATGRVGYRETESGIREMWAGVPVNLEDVSDETLHELAVSGQISEARYFEEFTRRHGVKRDPGYGRRVDADKIAIGVDPAHGADAMAYAFMRDGNTLGAMREFHPDSAAADLKEQLRIAKELEAFWRKVAASRGDRMRLLGDQVMEMGDMIDRLTGRETGA